MYHEENRPVIFVNNIRLAKYIIDAGFLNCLVKIRNDKFQDGNKVYVFESDDEDEFAKVQALVDEYKAQARAKRQQKKS